MGETYSEGTSTPGRSTANLGDIGQDGESVLVSEGNEDETEVSKGAHGGDSSRLLTSSHGSSGDEQSSVLAGECTLLPQSTGGVDERLELAGEVSVTGGDAEDDTVIVREVAGLSDGVAPLGRSLHLGEDLGGESLGNPEGSLSVIDLHNNVEVGVTYCKMSHCPPAASIPFFSASARRAMWPYME